MISSAADELPEGICLCAGRVGSALARPMAAACSCASAVRIFGFTLLTTFWELTTFWDGFDRETLLVEEAHHDASIGTNAASGPHGGRGDDLKRAPFLRCAKNVAEALLSRDQTMVWLNSTLIATSSLPYDRHEAADTTLSRRACTAPLSQRGRTLHRVQTMRSDLPGAGDHYRSGPQAQRRHTARNPL